MCPLYHGPGEATRCLMVQVKGTPTLWPGTASNGRTEAAGPGKRDQQGDGMKNSDKSRKWMWWFLGVTGAIQLYFVRELLAAFALFALGFGVIAFVVAALYLLHHGWVVAVGRVAESRHPAVVYAK